MRASGLTTFAIALALGSVVEIARGDALGTVFTYQGQLKDEGLPANDEYDFIFRLFDDPVGGVQVGGDFEESDWLVTDGLFTVELDFGPTAFTGDALWLQVSVRLSDMGGEYTDLLPRQPLNATPYALYALSGPGSGGYWAPNGDDIYNTNAGGVGIGTTTPASMLDVQSTAGTHGLMSAVPWIPVWAHRTGTTGTWPAVHGECDSEDPDGSAVRGIMTSTSSGSDSAGVLGVNNGYGFGVYGTSVGTGVCGETDSDWHAGVRGTSNATGVGFGVFGNHAGGGWGVYGVSSESTGVRGDTHGDLYTAGVHGHSNGLFGYGVHGTTDAGGVGVNGYAPSGIGVAGTTDSVAANAMGVYGVVNSTTPGGFSAGVRGHNNGTGGNGIGVYGSQDGSGWGVYGYTPSGRGVYGHSGDSVGVYGRCDAVDWSGIGVYGSHAGYGVGVHGVSANGIGVYGASTNGTYAGWFEGTVKVDVLEITGADVAEKFPVSNDLTDAQPGTVMEIDPENPGMLRVARGAYNRRVAGVVSGAGDIPAGTILGNMPGSEDSPPIALSGRVWVKCDATDTPIKLGDLLTTSNTPGRAMAVSDFSRAHGTVIGKAMTGLEEGTGLVLVLVNLQ